MDLNRIIKAANALDQQGLFALADMVDRDIRRIAEMEQDEGDTADADAKIDWRALGTQHSKEDYEEAGQATDALRSLLAVAGYDSKERHTKRKMSIYNALDYIEGYLNNPEANITAEAKAAEMEKFKEFFRNNSDIVAEASKAFEIIK